MNRLPDNLLTVTMGIEYREKLERIQRQRETPDLTSTLSSLIDDAIDEIDIDLNFDLAILPVLEG